MQMIYVFNFLYSIEWQIQNPDNKLLHTEIHAVWDNVIFITLLFIIIYLYQ